MACSKHPHVRGKQSDRTQGKAKDADGCSHGCWGRLFHLALSFLAARAKIKPLPSERRKHSIFPRETLCFQPQNLKELRYMGLHMWCKAMALPGSSDPVSKRGRFHMVSSYANLQLKLSHGPFKYNVKGLLGRTKFAQSWHGAFQLSNLL